MPKERVQLKLENPIGIAGRLLGTYGERIAGRKLVLREDFSALDTIEEQLAVYAADMRRDFKYHLSHVENVLYAMAERGDRFFDETLSIWRVWDLMNGDKLRAAFEREVVADTSREAERHINELVDWLVDREFRQWRDLTTFLERRTAIHADQIMGKLGCRLCTEPAQLDRQRGPFRPSGSWIPTSRAPSRPSSCKMCRMPCSRLRRWR